MNLTWDEAKVGRAKLYHLNRYFLSTGHLSGHMLLVPEDPGSRSERMKDVRKNRHLYIICCWC